MAKTNAERQAEYRASRKNEVRINTYIREEASWALSRLARHRGLSQKAMLEKLLIDADKKVEKGLADDEIDVYFTGKVVITQ